MQIQSTSKELQEAAESRHPSHTAVVLAYNLGEISAAPLLPEVGAVPILLRSILGAAKAGAGRIVVVIERGSRRQIIENLLKTRRLPKNIEWHEATHLDGFLPCLIGEVASQTDGHLVLIAGNRVYHPSLHKRASEWNADSGDALVLTSGRDLVGMCVLSREASIDLAGRCPDIANSLEDVLAWLTLTHSVESDAVALDTWQRVSNEDERISAERKLNSWLVKPTDGIFARANRRISIPISRRIIPFRITPNMVSLFTLGVSFAAGLFFALGGYWNTILGAVLSWASSVLDGCDGEVARLKLQESAFGCWLETICDNLYYLFTFGGLTIGLVRSSGNRGYLMLGGMSLVGAGASFLMTGLQRHKMTSGRPEQYLREWHRKAESRMSNPLLYLGRHTEFIVRRCFLPYLIMVVAVLGVTKWFLVGATFGANLVWMIALYSFLTFSDARPISSANPRCEVSI